jgi:YbbR domain-containing protein
MRDFFLRNWNWKLLSLAAAVLLWISVSGEPELTSFVSVPVEYKNLSPELEVASEVVESVMLEVRGPAAELRGTPGARPRYAVVLDMSGRGPGQHTFSVDPEIARMPRGVQLMRAIPSQIRLRFENSTERAVPVHVRLGGLPANLQVTAAVAQPAELTIAGPQSRVEQVANVETDVLPLKPEAGTAQYAAGVYVNDPRVRFAGAARVTVRVTIGPK